MQDIKNVPAGGEDRQGTATEIYSQNTTIPEISQDLTNEEIYAMYRDAADKTKQINILADLAAVPARKIIHLLTAGYGVKLDAAQVNRKRWTHEELLSMLADYEAGMPQKDIAVKYDVSRNNIHTYLSKARSIRGPKPPREGRPMPNKPTINKDFNAAIDQMIAECSEPAETRTAVGIPPAETPTEKPAPSPHAGWLRMALQDINQAAGLLADKPGTGAAIFILGGVATRIADAYEEWEANR